MKKLLLMLTIGMMLISLCACSAPVDQEKAFRVTVERNEMLYEPLKDSYEPGETVTIRVICATETSYHLLVNGEKVSQVTRNDLYVKFEFIMPEADVEVEIVETYADFPD